jgi:hypothetical protein
MKINHHHSATDPPRLVPARRQRRNRRDRLRACAAVAAMLLAAVPLTGCGGGSGNGGVAHIDGSNSTASSSSGSSGLSGYSHAELMKIALKYSACMRLHGLGTFPDPTEGSNGLPNFNDQSGGPSVQDSNSPQFQAADHACKAGLLHLAPQTAAATAAASAKALKYVACMRSHGEPGFPDPNGEGLIQINNATGILAPSSPQYETAQQACQSLDSGFGESSATPHHSK